MSDKHVLVFQSGKEVVRIFRHLCSSYIYFTFLEGMARYTDKLPAAKKAHHAVLAGFMPFLVFKINGRNL